MLKGSLCKINGEKCGYPGYPSYIYHVEQVSTTLIIKNNIMGKFEITYKESFRKNKKEIIFASSFGDAETKFRNEKLKRIEQIKEI